VAASAPAVKLILKVRIERRACANRLSTWGAGYTSAGRRTARRVSTRCRGALRRLQREQGLSSHVFMTERDGPMRPKAFHALFGRIGSRAKMQFPGHPHRLRHGCGYALANAGHDTRALQAWLGPSVQPVATTDLILCASVGCPRSFDYPAAR
jgi:integrase